MVRFWWGEVAKVMEVGKEGRDRSAVRVKMISLVRENLLKNHR